MRTAHAPLWLSLLISSSGCFFYYPELPKGPKLEVEAGKRIDLGLSSHDINYDCTGSGRGCQMTAEGWKRPGTYQTIDARYGDRSLKAREVRELADPDYDKKLAKIRSYKGTCNISIVPSAIAFISTVALPFVAGAVDKLGDAGLPVALGLVGGMVGGTALSYPLGGYACIKAGRAWKGMFKGVDPEESGFIVGDDQQAWLTEMEGLVTAFNAKFATGDAPSGTDDDDEDRSTDEDTDTNKAPAPKVEEPETPVAPPAVATGPYKAGDKVMVDWKGTPYKAVILKVEAGGRFRIHYEGYADSWDESIPSARLLGRQ